MTHTYNFTQKEFDEVMAHYAHSLLVRQSVRYNHYMSINSFRNENERAISIITQECYNEIAHDLTYEQISAAIRIYFDCETAKNKL